MKWWQPSFYLARINQVHRRALKNYLWKHTHIMSHCIYPQVQKEVFYWATTTAEAQLAGSSWPRDYVSACGSLFGTLGNVAGLGKTSSKAENLDLCLHLHQPHGWGGHGGQARPRALTHAHCTRLCFPPCVPLTWHPLIIFLVSLPFPRPLGLPAGLTLTTLPSDRAAWIRLPAGLATCRWSTLRWGWTPSSLKTRSLFCGRNTETSSGFEEPGRVGEGPREGLEDRVSCLSAACRSAQQRSQIVPSIQIN